MKLIDYCISDLVCDTNEFNSIAGNDTKLTKQDYEAQYKVLVEEVYEIKEALDTDNIVELVDGVIDTLVVISGFVQKLENQGINMSKAMELIAENNLSKYTMNAYVADMSVADYKSKGIEVVSEFNKEYCVYVLRDTNGKIRKPNNFKSVDISDCIPEGVKL